MLDKCYEIYYCFNCTLSTLLQCCFVIGMKIKLTVVVAVVVVVAVLQQQI